MKKLMNEVLPAPSRAPQSEVRDRVLRHMREALAAGASFALAAGCTPFGVVDPLPPPAKCKTVGSLDELVTGKVVDEGGGEQRRLSLTLKATDDSGLTFGSPTSTVGGVVESENSYSVNASLVIRADAGAATVELIFPVTCEDYRTNLSRPGRLRVVITLLNADGGMTSRVAIEELRGADGG